MNELDQPLHDIERALIATSEFLNREQLLEYKPLKIAMDKAQYHIQRALFGENVDYVELREYPSKTAVELSHPIILMENHNVAKKYEDLVQFHGTELYNRRMELVKSLNKVRSQQGEQALSVVWLPDMSQPLAVHTLANDDAKLARKIKKEDLTESDRVRSPTRLDTKLAKNRPIKKRPVSQKGPSKKKAARMRAT